MHELLLSTIWVSEIQRRSSQHWLFDFFTICRASQSSPQLVFSSCSWACHSGIHEMWKGAACSLGMPGTCLIKEESSSITLISMPFSLVGKRNMNFFGIRKNLEAVNSMTKWENRWRSQCLQSTLWRRVGNGFYKSPTETLLKYKWTITAFPLFV